MSVRHFVDPGANSVLQNLDIALGEKDFGQDIVFPGAVQGIAVLGCLVGDGDFLLHLKPDVLWGFGDDIHPAIVFGG